LQQFICRTIRKSIATRHKEHTRYIRTNNLISAYALHILNNRHEYGIAEETLELLKPCNKGTKLNCWEALYMHAFYQHNILIEEQKVNDINPLYELAQHVITSYTFPDSVYFWTVQHTHTNKGKSSRIWYHSFCFG